MFTEIDILYFLSSLAPVSSENVLLFTFSNHKYFESTWKYLQRLYFST